jgi:hypothetical protein
MYIWKKNKMKLLNFALLSLFLTTAFFAQVSFEKRLEFDLKEEYSGHAVHLYGKDGFVIRSVGTKNKGFRDFKYELYSTELELKNEHIEQVSIGKIYLSKTFESSEYFIDLLYEKSGATTVITVEGKSLKTNSIKFNLPPQMYSLSGEVSDKYLFLHGRIKKSPVVVVVDWHTGQNQLIPLTFSGYKGTQLSVDDISVLANGNEAIFSIKAIKGKKSERFILLVDARDGSKQQLNISQGLDKKFGERKCYRGRKRQVYSNRYLFIKIRRDL